LKLGSIGEITQELTVPSIVTRRTEKTRSCGASMSTARSASCGIHR